MRRSLVVLGKIFVVIGVSSPAPAVIVSMLGVVIHPVFLHFAVAEIDLDPAALRVRSANRIYKVPV